MKRNTLDMYSLWVSVLGIAVCCLAIYLAWVYSRDIDDLQDAVDCATLFFSLVPLLVFYVYVCTFPVGYPLAACDQETLTENNDMFTEYLLSLPITRTQILNIHLTISSITLCISTLILIFHVDTPLIPVVAAGGAAVFALTWFWMLLIEKLPSRGPRRIAFGKG
ncbi:hypothetical protein ACFL1X_13095 [Candidatus Hydrogenedentota bacterium]